jgi:2-dehydropantoate 2-reductase
MRVLVLGAGATGAYFGNRLIESGADVSFLVRPRRATALASQGLVIRATSGTVQREVDAITAVQPGSRFDLVLLSCKAYDLDSAISAIASAVESGARVLPLLNGLRHLDALDAAFGRDRVLGGLCHISVALTDDGSVRQVGSIARLTFGSRAQTVAVPGDVRDGLLSIPEEIIHSADVMSAMWQKFAFLAALAGITCLMRANLGAIVAVPEGAEMIRWIYLECAEVARRSGFPPDDGVLSEALDILTAPHSPLKASMLRDLERGQRTEVEHVLGDMLGRAVALGVDAPLLSAACTQLRIHEARLASGER